MKLLIELVLFFLMACLAIILLAAAPSDGAGGILFGFLFSK